MLLKAEHLAGEPGQVLDVGGRQDLSGPGCLERIFNQTGRAVGFGKVALYLRVQGIDLAGFLERSQRSFDLSQFKRNPAQAERKPGSPGWIFCQAGFQSVLVSAHGSQLIATDRQRLGKQPYTLGMIWGYLQGATNGGHSAADIDTWRLMIYQAQQRTGILQVRVGV